MRLSIVVVLSLVSVDALAQYAPPPANAPPGQPQHGQPASPLGPAYHPSARAGGTAPRGRGAPNLKTMIGGAALFGAMYIATASAWAILRDQEGRRAPQNILFVPVVGPLLAIRDVDLVYAEPKFAVTGLVWNGILQLVGIGGLIIGALGGGRDSYSAIGGSTWAVAPAFGPAGGALEFHTRF